MGSEPRRLIASYAASVDADRRRRFGVHYTPPLVAERLVAIALEDVRGEPLVCDPACGAGAFLLAAADALAARGISRDRVVRELLWGIDRDADAVAVARSILRDWSDGADPGDHLVVADGLTFDAWAGRFDAVVGNPPFLNQLERATVRGRAGAVALSARFGDAARAYTDTASLFLLAAMRMARPGGRVVLVQPDSLLAARDAAGVRSAVLDGGAIEGLWVAGELVFEAAVSVCAPVVRVGGSPQAAVRRWVGAGVDEVAASSLDLRSLATWGGLAWQPDVPEVSLDGSAGRVGDLSTATAGFRDEYYALVDAVVEREEGTAPKLLTSGLIEPGRVAWGERAARFGKRSWHHPRVELDSVTSPKVRPWVEDRLVPKVVVATQSRVVEAAVDEEGDLVPSTPVIAVHTRSDRLWLVAAALVAPPVSVWARRTYAGAALAAGAVKLSAKQVLEVPLPADEEAWHAAAAALQAGDVVECAAAMTGAHGAAPEIFDWWRQQARL